MNLPLDVQYSIQPVYDTVYTGIGLEEKIDDLESDIVNLKSQKKDNEKSSPQNEVF